MRYKIAGGIFVIALLVVSLGNIGFSNAEEKNNRDTSGTRSVIYPELSNELSRYEAYGKSDTLIEAFLKKWQIKGASVAVVKNGDLVMAKGYGMAIEEDSTPVSPLHLFRIASVSKLITAVAIMKLVEEGKLHLDDKVFGNEGILSEDDFGKPVDPRAYDITVRQLLMHEGGWTTRYGDHLFMPHTIARYMGTDLPVSEETIIKFALSKKLHYTPGKGIAYSNLGYIILGEVIEELSGIEYEKYVQTAVLHPLGIFGMEITSNKYEDKHPLEVKYYDVEGAGERPSVYGTGENAPRTYQGTDFETLGAAGGWVASPAQILKLIVSIDGFSEVEDILTCSSIEEMTTLENPDKYGYGWVHAEEGNWWRTGTLSGTSAFVMRRNDGISYMVVTNTGSWKGSRFAYELKDLMEDEVIPSIRYWPERDLFDNLAASQIKLLTIK